mmetsp:Transcript_8194/g.11039  ORF Transcript_8194/g.11039 Transcript_8194/m.11039 type:complete len:110 (-) Transcript_8194:355-684(-)
MKTTPTSGAKRKIDPNQDVHHPQYSNGEEIKLEDGVLLRLKKEEEIKTRDGTPITAHTRGAANKITYKRYSPQKAILHISKSRDIDLFQFGDTLMYANKILKKVHPHIG